MPAKRWAWPMAMPPDTPLPCIVKQTVEAARTPSAVMALLLGLAELGGEEGDHGRERGFLVRAVGLHLDGRAEARGQHHDAHDALGVHAPAGLGDPHAA